YALKVLRDEGFLKKKKYLVLVGGNEERGSDCLYHYFNELKKPAPDYGFTPDANFPLIYGEKGILTAEYKGGISSKIISLKAGTASNAVIGEATVVLRNQPGLKDKAKQFFTRLGYSYEILIDENTTITVFGKSAHASLPHLGKNAGVALLKFLATVIDNDIIEHYSKLFSSYNGDSLHINFQDEELGKLTMNLGLINIEKNHYSFIINIRYPFEFIKKEGIKILEKQAKHTFVVLSDSKPLYVDPNSPFINSLLKSYQDITNDFESKPQTIGGGTYARQTINSVAFGMNLPHEEEVAHQANEYVDLDTLKTGLKIYILALIRLENL
ncbi:MAG: Sapep family Mn(2+)-dependent dipeptidase, partial [Bacillales bacterium]|nr:Sapep family Mn(2+)-dependent dipeptidase [Bacillales bacterium]